MKTAYVPSEEMTNLRNSNNLLRLPSQAIRTLLVCLLAVCGVGESFATSSVVKNGNTTTITWDFSEYTENTQATNEPYNSANPQLAALIVNTGTGAKDGSYTDFVSKNGFRPNGASTSTTRFLKYTPSYGGHVTVTYISNNGSANDRIVAIGKSIVTGSDVNTLKENTNVLDAGLTEGYTEKTLNADLIAGTDYYFYIAYSGCTIKKIVYVYEESADPDPTPDPVDDEELFKATATTAYTVPANTTTPASLVSYATITGGEMYVVNAQTAEKNLVQADNFQMTNGNTFFKVTLSKALQENDRIDVKIKQNSAARGIWLHSFVENNAYPNGEEGIKILTASNGSAYENCSYTINSGDYLIGQTDIYIYRATGNTTNFQDFTITRPGSGHPDPTPAPEWESIEMTLNAVGLLTTEDMTKVDGKYPTVDFGISLDNEGNVIRVAKGASNAIGSVTGNYHSDHGMNPFSMTLNVPGSVKITAGTCSYGTTQVKVNGSAVGEAVIGDNATTCWKNNKSNIATGIYTGEAGTITITTGPYTPYIKVEKITVESYTVTFSKGSVECEGTQLPENKEVVAGESIKIPANHTLYKEGYTLTGWNDGVNTYNAGSNFTPTANVTLTPVFTENTKNLKDRTTAVTVKWDFGPANGAPTLANEGKENLIYVTQATVEGQTIDVKLDYSTKPGKVNNAGRSDKWCQMNTGTKFIIPSCAGATFSIESNNVTTGLTVNGVAATGNTNNIYSTTIAAADNTAIVVLADDGKYYSYLQMELPYVEPEPVVEWKDIKMDFTGESSFIREVTTTPWASINTGIAVADNGTVSAVAVGAANSKATLTGSYHSTDNGISSGKLVVPVAGSVKISIGCNNNGTKSWVVTDDNDNEVVTFTSGGTMYTSTNGSVAVAYYDGPATTLTINGSGTYTGYIAVEEIDPALIPCLVSFSNSDATVEGSLPTSTNVSKGSQYTVPVNYRLYKEGYTLASWVDTDGNSYAPGQQITVNKNIKLSPVFTQNESNLADRNTAVTVKWALNKAKSCNYSIQGNGNTCLGFFVTQATVNGKSIDVKLGIDATNGKFGANNDSWTQVTSGTIFQVPSANGAAIEMKVYGTLATATIDGSTDYTQNGNIVTYTVASNNNPVEVVADDKMSYIEYLQVTLPNIPRVATPTITDDGNGTVTIACETEGATIHYTTDGTDPTAENDTYSAPFTLTETKTVKAIAVKDGLANSQVASKVVTVASGEFEFRDIKFDFTNSNLLAAEEKITSVIVDNANGKVEAGPLYEYGITVNGDGSFNRVDANASNCAAIISGRYRGDDEHGGYAVKMKVRVDGPVKISIKGCQFWNPNNAPATIYNGDTKLAELDVIGAGCSGVCTYEYAGDPTELTINGADFTPYIWIEKATHTWDFRVWSDATKAQVCGASDWTPKESDSKDYIKGDELRFINEVNTDASGNLKAGGSVIAELEGLHYDGLAQYGLAMAFDYQSLQDGNQDKGWGPYASPTYLWVTKSASKIVIPNVKAGTTFKLASESHKYLPNALDDANARGFKVTYDGVELTSTSGTYTSQALTEFTYTIPANANGFADVVLEATAGCHIYYIDAEIDPGLTVLKPVMNILVNGSSRTLTKGEHYDTDSKGAISFYSDNPSVATVDSETGEITPVALGQANITIRQEADGIYLAGEKKIVVNVVETEDITFDFANWPADNAILKLDGSNKVKAWSAANNNVQDAEYVSEPYSLAGYFAFQSSHDEDGNGYGAWIRTGSSAGNNGLRNFGRARGATILSLKSGDVVTFTGKGLSEGMFRTTPDAGSAAGSCTVTTDGSTATVTMTSAGNLDFIMDKDGNTVIYSITLPGKDTPQITSQPVGGMYRSGSTVTLSVSAAGADRYQWYVSDSNSDHGGTAISGATSNTYNVPTAVAGDKYYYCLLKNSTIGTIVPTNVAHVEVANIFWRNIELNLQSDGLLTTGNVDNYVVVPESGVAEIVKNGQPVPSYYNAIISANRYNDSQHGYINLKMKVPVLAGFYKLTIGNCQYPSDKGGTQYTVTSGTETLSDASFSRHTQESSTSVNVTPVEDQYLPFSNNMGQSLSNGALIWGDPNVASTAFTDLSRYSSMKLYGTGTVRMLFNRATDATDPADYQEIYKEITPEGVTLDLTTLNKNFAHLNAIKAPWGNEVTANLYKIELTPKSKSIDMTINAGANCYNSNQEAETTTTQVITITNDTELEIKTTNGYTPYIKIEEMEKPTEATAIFELGGEEGVEGTLPANETFALNPGTYTIPANKTLYKKGYTLVGWMTNDEVFYIGDKYIHSGNSYEVHFTPVFRENTKSLKDIKEPLTVKWDLTNNGTTPVWSSVQNTDVWYVIQVTIDGEKIDFPVKIDTHNNGKLHNEGRDANGGAQVNSGTTLTVPSVYGAVPSYGSYYKDGDNEGKVNHATTTVAGGNTYTQTGSSRPYAITYPAVTTEEATIDFVMGSDYGGYTYYVQMVYPASSKDPVITAMPKSKTETTVTITAGDGATIYYSMDDSDPVMDDAHKYTDPFDITVDKTIKAIAIETGKSPSRIVTAEAKIMSGTNVAYLYSSAYPTYCGIDSDPLYKALSKHTDYHVVPFDINGKTADNINEINLYETVIVSEAMSGGNAKTAGTFEVALKDKVGSIPMISMKTFFYGSFNDVERWSWGKTFNPVAKDGTTNGVSNIRVADTDKQKLKLFEGILFNGLEAPLFNSTGTSNRIQGVEFTDAEASNCQILATVDDGTTEGAHTAVFSRGNNFIGINYSCDAIQDINGNGIRLVENAIDILIHNTGWASTTSEGPINRVTYTSASGKVDLTTEQIGELSDGLAIIIPEKMPTSISVSVVQGTAPTVTYTEPTGTFTWGGKKYQIQFSTTSLDSTTPADAATGVGVKGTISFTFSDAMKSTDIPQILFNGVRLNGKLTNENKTISYTYGGLQYDTQYTLSVPARTFINAVGVPYSRPINITFTTAATPSVEKGTFHFIVDSNLDDATKTALEASHIAHGTIDQAIAAARGASTSATNRFYIFVPDGVYHIGANESNEMTTLQKSYVSIIGQSMDKTIIWNKPTTEGIGSTATLDVNNGLDIYLQDLTLENRYGGQNELTIPAGAAGRAAALMESGSTSHLITKNVKLNSNQDTYYTWNGNFGYHEGSVITGTVDFICGGGNYWFEGVTLQLNNRGGNVITAPSTSDGQWGYVFSNSIIDRAAGATKVVNKGFHLGRDWQGSPAATYLNTTMKVLPADAGWTNMSGTALPVRFHEYGSKDANGNLLDLSKRSLNALVGGQTGKDNPVLTAEQAAEYTIENVFAGTQDADGSIYDPRVYTIQVAAPVAQKSSIDAMTWTDNGDALCFVIFRDGKFVGITQSNTYTFTEEGSYTVRAANARGGLGEASNAIVYSNKIPTSWDFTKVVGAGASETYWITGDDYGSVKFVDGTTNVDGGAYLKLNDFSYLQEAFGLKFNINSTSDDQLRCYVNAKGFIAPANDNVTIYIPTTGNGQVIRYVTANVTTDSETGDEIVTYTNHYVKYENAGIETARTDFGATITEDEVKGYYTFKLDRDTYLTGIALIANTVLSTPVITNNGYDRVAGKWNINITAVEEDAVVYYKIGDDGVEVNSGVKSVDIPVEGGQKVIAWADNASGIFTPSQQTNLTTEVVTPSLNIALDHNGLMALTTAHSEAATLKITVTGQYLGGEASLTLPDLDDGNGTLSIYPTTFTPASDGSLNQNFWLTWTNTETATMSPTTKQITFKVGGTQQSADITFERRVAYDATKAPVVVKSATKWDWTYAPVNTNTAENGAGISLTSATTPTRYEYVTMGQLQNMSTMDDGASKDDQHAKTTIQTNPAIFHGNALQWEGQRVYRYEEGKDHFGQGDYLAFNAGCDGLLSVTFSSTGSIDRGLYLTNGDNVKTMVSHAPNTNVVTINDIPVKAGKVILEGYLVDQSADPTPQYLRFFEMTFTAQAQAPVITEYESTTGTNGEIVGTHYVTLTTDDPNDEIIYTLDGSEPTRENGKLYTGKFIYAYNTAIQAKTVTTGKLPSETSILDARTYPTHTLKVQTPDRHGSVTLTPSAPDNLYIEGTTITLTASARTGYVFKDFSLSETDQTSLSATSPYNHKLDADATIYAFFQKGKEGTVIFSLEHVYLTDADGNTVDTDVSATAKAAIAESFVYPESITSTALSIPSYYILYWDDHTLLHWEDDSHNKYLVGSSQEYENAGDEITLYPVFKVNGKTNAFDSRTEPATVTWDFRTAYGAQPGMVPTGVPTDLHMATQATVAYTDTQGHTVHEAVDVPLTFSTKDGGYVNNTEHDEWVTFGEGLVFNVPSGAGARFQLATYGKLTDTTIDGKLATDFTEAVDDNDIPYYIYKFATDNTASSVPLVIGSDRSYYKYLTAEVPSGDKVVLTATVNNTGMGKLSLSAGNTSLGNDRYSYNRGTYVTLTANRERFYDFDHWEVINGEQRTTVGNSATLVNGITYTPGATVGGKPTLSFQLDDYAAVHAVFKDKKSYYINFTAGGESTMAYGLPLYQQHVEDGEAFEMPDHNQQLYVEGYTLKYYVDEDDHRYDFGNTYTNGVGEVPAKDLYLTPVFEANTKTLADITTATTLTFPLGGEGAPEINYRNSSGIIVEQITIDGEKIDMPCYITSASNSELADNVSNKAYCHVEGSATKFSVQTTKGCVITLKSTGTGISKVVIAGATSTGNGANATKYTAGNTVNVTYNGTAVSQDLNMNGSKLNLTELDVTYQPFAEARPVLTSLTVGNTALSAAQLNQLRNGTLTINHAMTAANYSDALPVLANAVVTNSGTATITQATAENPTATVQVKTASGLVVGTYHITFNVTSTALPQCTLAKVGDITVPTDGSNGAVGVGTNGVIRLTFDHKMAETTVTAINSQTMVAASDRTLAFTYWDLQENTNYTFQVAGTEFKDVYGQSIAQNNIVISFTTGSKVNVTKRLFNYVADDKLSEETKKRLSARGIPHGPLSVQPAQMSGANSNGAIAKADDAFGAIHNAKTSATERFYVFVPDGEYQMAGNIYRTVETADNKEKNKTKYTDVYNGDTWINNDYISIVGQSQDGTIITNTPKYFYGISYTSTLEVKAKKQSCYFQDFTLDNRWSKFQVDRGDANPEGQAVAFYDRGIKTILKNVTMKGYQDTYASSSNTSGSSTSPGCFKTWRYYEDCENWGTVDFFCGAGDDWWERPTIVLRKRQTDNNIVAPRHFYDLTESYTGADKGFKEDWGYVYNNALIKAESDAAFKAQNGKFTIGRTWQNSPAMTFLSPRYEIMAADRGYNTMSQGLICRLHEYDSRDANTDLPIDLTKRTIRSATPAAGSDDCVMTESQASRYTLHNVLGGSDAYDPTIYTEQVDMSAEKLYVEPNRISWDAQEKALCYFVFRLESNGKYELYDITTAEYLTMSSANVKDQFVVRAANSRGGLGPQSQSVVYYETSHYDLAVNEISSLTPEDKEAFGGHSWSTICLPHGAIVPDGSYDTATGMVDTQNDIHVYAVTYVNELDVHLKKVQHLDAHVGYVVYAKPGATYRFLASEKPAEHDSRLNGYAPDYLIEVDEKGHEEEKPSTEPLDRLQANVNCYTLAYKSAHGIGFYKYNNTTLAPYRAWLDADLVDSSVDAKASMEPQKVRLRFVFDDDPFGGVDGIDGVTDNSSAVHRIYDLQGKRVTEGQLQPGRIYIINGKKVLVK